MWWRLRKPRLTGCRVLALDERGWVLLVRHSYGSGRWMLPGGGVGRRENPLAAAQRELREEVGCTLDDPRQFDQLDEPLSGTVNQVHLIGGRIVGTPRPDGREIVEAVFFDPAALPGDMALTVARGLPGWITAAKAARLRPPVQV
ncbi:MAG: NUDIX domain-containing protein [Proteobacteria bacterium]|nr:NUDIX domain-containing protein [Pseudomonadota bacterium]